MRTAERVIDRLAGRKIIGRGIRDTKGGRGSSGGGVQIGLDHRDRGGLRCTIRARERDVSDRARNNSTCRGLITLQQRPVWIRHLSETIDLELPCSRIKRGAARIGQLEKPIPIDRKIERIPRGIEGALRKVTLDGIQMDAETYLHVRARETGRDQFGKRGAARFESHSAYIGHIVSDDRERVSIGVQSTDGRKHGTQDSHRVSSFITF
jgi:hypothetical protein